MKKFLSFLLCILLFSGCSQPAAEESPTPILESTPTPIETVSAPTAPPSPTPYAGSKIGYFKGIINYDFEATSNAVLKKPEDFSSEKEFYEFIYQDCERRHQELISFIKSNQLTELFLWVDF